MATWQELANRFGITPHRRRLLAGLHAAGCQRVYIDGSFVTAKRRPNDFDGCWDMTGVDPERLDAVLLTFDRGRATQKAKYRGELFPAQFPASPSGTTYLEFFQLDKEGTPKGIVVIDLQEFA